MLKLTFIVALIGLIFGFGVSSVLAAETRDISSVSVLTDQRLAVPLSELASLYTRESMVTVSNTFGASENQVKRIEDGEAADLFITANPELIQRLRLKGMVDVHSITRVASHNKDVHYMAAVVASENMTPARAFLAYLKTDEARIILMKNGLTIP